MIRKSWMTVVFTGAACVGLFGSTALAQHHEEGHEEAHAKAPAATADRVGDAYPLTTCPVSGETLGEMGDAVVKVYDGREVRFCCDRCVAKFEADKDKYWKQVDEQIIKAQLPAYPMSTCVVSGEEFGGDMGEPVNMVYNNRLVRLCCDHCKKDFTKDPAKYLKKIDAAVVEKQAEHYPLTTCLVSNEEMGQMGDVVERVYANHLVRFCCEHCIGDFENSPGKYLASLDKAWMAMHDKFKGEHSGKAHGEGFEHEKSDR